jgi:hypothetical protein
VTDYDATIPASPVDLLKDPYGIIDIPFNWAKELEGDTISTSDVVLADGLTEVSDTASGATRIIRVSGGSDGYTYRVANRIITTNGRRFEKTVRVLVQER